MSHAYRSSHEVYADFGRPLEKWRSLIDDDSVQIEDWIAKPQFEL